MSTNLSSQRESERFWQLHDVSVNFARFSALLDAIESQFDCVQTCRICNSRACLPARWIASAFEGLYCFTCFVGFFPSSHPPIDSLCDGYDDLVGYVNDDTNEEVFFVDL